VVTGDVQEGLMRLGGFRSRERDLRTDTRRLERVTKAINEAIAEARLELDGLQRRMKTDADNAGFLFGAELDSQTKEDPKSDAELRSVELRLTRGGQRLEELRGHIRHLSSLKEQVGSTMAKS
jgi:hypothetical protein